MAATITEIARHAGVSVPLVSRYVNRDSNLKISEEKRRKIELAKEQLGGLRRRNAVKNTEKLACNFIMPINRSFSMEWINDNIGNAPFVKNLESTLGENGFRLSISLFDIIMFHVYA